jgi:hypothetical protein
LIVRDVFVPHEMGATHFSKTMAGNDVYPGMNIRIIAE